MHNDRLIEALMTQAFSALNASPGARAYYNQLKARGTGHHAALRQLTNRLVDILHGCLKTRTCYDEATAWSHRVDEAAAWHPSSWDVYRVIAESGDQNALGQGVVGSCPQPVLARS